jgi:hypothetical protein
MKKKFQKPKKISFANCYDGLDENDVRELIENPKEKIGQAKPSLHHVPPRVLLEVAQAMMEGSKKYGIYNYRKAGVSFSTYYSSTFRHLIAWFEGEDIDPDSGLSHITKAISGLIVLRDSMLENNYQDDRPNTK